MPIEDAEGGGTLQYWVEERSLSGTVDVRTVNVSLLEVRNRYNGIVYTILPKMGGGVVRTTARRDFLEFGTRVTIHQPLDVRSVHVSTGFAPNINEVHMLDGDGNAVQQINRIRVAEWAKFDTEWGYPVNFNTATIFGAISSGFGSRVRNGVNENHRGLDFGASTVSNLDILAVNDGIVVYSSTGGGFGYVVVIQHTEQNKTTLYSHLASISVSNEQTVTRGQKIGVMGNTTADRAGGAARVDANMAVHLHFELSHGLNSYAEHIGKQVDPTILWR
ncbi:MAG: M23 family metallopeptidase [Defluviitaleaceae bacterium]|nr:M23 family metallopeptidase [Defluviitaleaceae bacterium]